jgi:hypothetical protein
LGDYKLATAGDQMIRRIARLCDPELAIDAMQALPAAVAIDGESFPPAQFTTG